MSNKPIIITVKRSSDPVMLELWSCNQLWAVVNSDLFYPQIDIPELLGYEGSASEAEFELRLVPGW